MSGVSLPAIGRAGPAVSAGLRRGVAALGALRWLVPTALFEGCRDFEPHYMPAAAFHDALTQAGFEILDAKRTFLAEISWPGLGASRGGRHGDRPVRGAVNVR